MELDKLFTMERDLTKCLFNMERRGIRIDPSYCTKAMAWEHKEMANAAWGFENHTGRKFKDSPKLFAEVFTKLGDKYPITDKGNPSFNAEVLADINTPVARLIKSYRNHEKRAGTYYSSFLLYSDMQSRVHASANQAGTTTGRLSYSDPNLQNVPKEEGSEAPFVVRGSFIPSPENKLVSIDYDQQEYRMMLDYAGETKLIDQIMQGHDVHQATADLIGTTRTQAKTINFALLYGQGVEALAKSLNMPMSNAKELRYLYFSKLPKVELFLKTVRASVEARGFVYNWLGRRSHITNYSESYKIPNHLIQGGCADVCKSAIVEIDKALGDVGLVVQVHDELVFDMNPEQFSHIPEIMSIMKSIYPSRNGMDLTVSCDYSDKSWANRDKVMYVL